MKIKDKHINNQPSFRGLNLNLSLGTSWHHCSQDIPIAAQPPVLATIEQLVLLKGKSSTATCLRPLALLRGRRRNRRRRRKRRRRREKSRRRRRTITSTRSLI